MEQLKKILPYVLARLKEPTTWVGIAVFLGFFGISEETIGRISVNGVAIVTAVGALLAIFIPEAAPAPAETPEFTDPR